MRGTAVVTVNDGDPLPPGAGSSVLVTRNPASARLKSQPASPPQFLASQSRMFGGVTILVAGALLHLSAWLTIAWQAAG